MIDGEDEEDQFLFEGESDADINVRVEIQGAWLHDLHSSFSKTDIEHCQSNTVPNRTSPA